MRFEELELNDNVLDALYDMRFDVCTPVQEKCIPEILHGKDVLGVAQTGTGKTAAYLLPILSQLDNNKYPDKAINCVIMSPTRELAQQIDQAMQGFGYYLNGVSSIAVYGGNDGNRYEQEVKSLRLGADVVIATPGRLISHLSLGNVDLSKVSYFVLDEADRMLDMGFSEDIMNIAKHLPKTCQTIMFSATMPKKIEDLAKTLLKNPVEIKLAVSKPAEKIQQQAYICYETQKMGIIKDIFKAGDLKRVIIFCGSKMKVKQVAGALQRKKINCGEMHSDLDQAMRDDVMFKFKSGQFDVLVATDIVSRGIDIDDIAMVINYDVPHDAEDYVHRIGRTARAERDGVAITLVSEDDIYYFQQIEKFLDKEVQKNPIPEELGDTPNYQTKEKPSRNGRTSAKNRRRKDREQTSHKDSKRRNNTYRRKSENTACVTTNTEQYSNKRQEERQSNNKTERSKERKHSQQQSRSHDTSSLNEAHSSNNRQQQVESTTQPKTNKSHRRRRGNVEGNYKKRNDGQRHNTTVPPTQKEGKIKKFLKSIFGLKK